MNKNEFLRQLDHLLSDIPAEERKEAMEYYVEYFAEAGTEKEADVIKELVSPEAVAQNIREEMAGKDAAHTSVNKGKKEVNGWQIAFIVLLCIFLAPIVIPLACAVLGIAIGLIVTVAALLFAAVVTVVALVGTFAVAAIALFVVGLSKVLVAPVAGVLIVGISLLCAGLFLLFAFLTVKLCAVVIPATVKGIIYIIGLPFRKKEGVKKVI